MRAALSFISILMVLGIGFLVYSSRLQSGTEGETLPQQTNLTAVRRDLLSLGQAERIYQATNGRYATGEQLRSSGVMSYIPRGDRWGYEYVVEAEGADNFYITASPIEAGQDFPTLFIDKSMQITK